ncbi:unnamed protein product [Rhizophagus irregularis]|uniref:Endonuclease/exonuclease/phosphatase domain-containing protein n=1 Tax=Rhizophagus irregularis TaxID=588596 RepID=A0A2I1H390_9GLOM|nr:hypothetical protein RhiirA4_471491 [Rhizophagus irregularis]CAB4414369.1 unnamed protein product [Rhizophagus irregularis]
MDCWIGTAKDKDLNIIIMGDFNELDKGMRNNKEYINVIEKYHYLDVHKILANNNTIYTWSNGITSLRIDYVFTNDNLMDELIDHEIIKEDLINSDHKLLTIKVRIRYEKEQKIGEIK